MKKKMEWARLLLFIQLSEPNVDENSIQSCYDIKIKAMWYNEVLSVMAHAFKMQHL